MNTYHYIEREKNNMKDLIYYIVIIGLFVVNVAALFVSRKKDNSAYRIVFLTRHIDWLLAFLLVIFVTTSFVLIEPFVPEFLKFSLFSLLGKDGGNANAEIVTESSKISPIITIIVFIILMLFLPKAAYWEEQQFRHNSITIQTSILTNIKFGLMHCLVGVPIWIGLLLCLVGFIYSLKYIFTFWKYVEDKLEVESSTSLHGKYNIILITILLTAVLITSK